MLRLMPNLSKVETKRITVHERLSLKALLSRGGKNNNFKCTLIINERLESNIFVMRFIFTFPDHF